ncbi:MAG: hypothetical protein ABUK01_06040 [Leptospirales bacterium]
MKLKRTLLKSLAIGLILMSNGLYAQNDSNGESEASLTRVVALPFENKTGNSDIDWLGQSLPGVITQYVNGQFVIENASGPKLEKAKRVIGRKSSYSRNALGTVATLTKSQVAISGFYTWDEETQKVIITSYLYIIPLKLFVKLPPVESTLEGSELFGVMNKTAELITVEVSKIGQNSYGKNSNKLAFNDKPFIVFLACTNPEKDAATDIVEFQKLDLPVAMRQLLNGIERKFSRKIVYRQSKQQYLQGNCSALLKNPLEQIESQFGSLPPNAFVYTGFLQKNKTGIEYKASLYSVDSKKREFNDSIKSETEGDTIESIPETVTNDAATNLITFFKTKKHKIGVSVNGLNGTGLEIILNENESLKIQSDGHVKFRTAVYTATPYKVTIKNIPETPRQKCYVSNGEGVVSVSDVDNVEIFCVKERFAVLYEVNGLNGTVDISLNGNEIQNVLENGKYEFKDTVADQESYDIKIKNSPTNQKCKASNGTGKINGKAETIQIDCRFLPTFLLYALAGYPLWVGNSDTTNGSLQVGGDLPLSTLQGTFNVHIGLKAERLLPWNIGLLLDIGFNAFSGSTKLLDSTGATVEDPVDVTGFSIDILPLLSMDLLPGKHALMPLLGFGASYQSWDANFGQLFTGFLPMAGVGVRYELPLGAKYNLIAQVLTRLYFLPTDQIRVDTSLSVGVTMFLFMGRGKRK